MSSRAPHPYVDTYDASSAPQVTLALASNRRTIGATYYDPTLRKLFVLEDSQDTDQHDLVSLLVEQIRPELVLLSSRSDDELVDRVKVYLDALNDESGTLDHRIEIRPSREFSETLGRVNLGSLRILEAMPSHGGDEAGGQDENSDDYETDAALKLASFVNMQAPVMVRRLVVQVLTTAAIQRGLPLVPSRADVDSRARRSRGGH